MGNDNYAAIPVRLIFPDAPLKIDHTVIHTPYPRPEIISIKLRSQWGREWVLPPIYARGGTHYPLTMPPQIEGDEWNRLEVDIRYELLASRYNGAPVHYTI